MTPKDTRAEETDVASHTSSLVRRLQSLDAWKDYDFEIEKYIQEFPKGMSVALPSSTRVSSQHRSLVQ